MATILRYNSSKVRFELRVKVKSKVMTNCFNSSKVQFERVRILVKQSKPIGFNSSKVQFEPCDGFLKIFSQLMFQFQQGAI